MKRSLKIESKKKSLDIKKEKYNISLRKRRLFVLILILVFFTCFFINKGFNKEKLIFSSRSAKATSTNISEEDLNVGNYGYISEAIVTQRKTGIGPFDENNEPGNDMDEDNNIVRSFDQIVWTIENTLSLKNVASGEHYSGGVIEIEATLPAITIEGVPVVYKWNTDFMSWAENIALLDDGRTVKAEYKLPQNQVTIPGKQNIQLCLSVLGAPNGLDIKPTFTSYLAGNEENEKVVFTDSSVIVSAAPRLNMQIAKNMNINYKGLFDTNLGDKVNVVSENTVYGRMQGYAVSMMLYNESSSKKLKGIELPKGDITFDLEFNETLGTTNVSDDNTWTPKLWDYKDNNNNNSGIYNRNMLWNNDLKTRYSYTWGPYNAGSTERCCYNGGDWLIEQDETKPYLYHVTIKNYKTSCR